MSMALGIIAFWALLVVFVLGLFTPAASVPVATADMEVLLSLKAAWTGVNLGSWKKGRQCAKIRGVTCNANGRVTSLYLSESTLKGTIPSTIGRLTALQVLILTGTKLTGTIPESLGNLRSLQGLSLVDNMLIGPIPSTIGKLKLLEYMDLSLNLLTGQIPVGIGNLKPLTNLLLYGNRLTGHIPSSIGNLKTLYSLYLRSNQLTGVIPDSIGSIPVMNQLDLSSNNLIGAIPASLGNLKDLVGLALNNNRLTGSIPVGIGKLSVLERLDLHSNLLAGTIPLPSTTGNQTALTYLDLSSNQLSGSAPTSFLSSLPYYNVTGNYLTDLAPPKGNQILACPQNSQNCITKSTSCTIDAQRPAAECALFCRVAAGVPACSGHGFCYQAPGGSPSCICDPNFKPGTAPFTCVPQ